MAWRVVGEMKTAFRTVLLVLGLMALVVPCYGLISVGELTKAKAEEMGIVMKQRPNGDAGVKVWIEFRREGFMKDLSYCEMRLEDGEGVHVISARLEPNAGVHGLEEGVESFSFSVDPGKLERCSFFVVAQPGIRTATGYYLRVANFFEN